VNPLDAVNVDALVIVFDDKAPEFEIDADDKAPVLVIVFDVNAPEFEIDADDKAPVLVIVFDDKAPVLLIVFDCNVFSVDGPKTFKELVRILSLCNARLSNDFLLNVVGITLFGKFIDG